VRAGYLVFLVQEISVVDRNEEEVFVSYGLDLLSKGYGVFYFFGDPKISKVLGHVGSEKTNAVFVAVGQPGNYFEANGEGTVVEPAVVVRFEEIEKLVLLDQRVFELYMLFVVYIGK
jgi:hypothetical protein